jgi:hypothetical protein
MRPAPGTLPASIARYRLVESRDPFESKDVGHLYGLAADLVPAGNRVTLFLAQNGVLASRAAANFAELDAVVKAGVEVLADEFYLRERGIRPDALRNGVKAARLDVVVDQLADGGKAMWH